MIKVIIIKIIRKLFMNNIIVLQYVLLSKILQTSGSRGLGRNQELHAKPADSLRY